jgi:predicted aconitase with swiveling domain
MSRFSATVLNPGAAAGPVLALDEPLSFWGAFDTRTGAIIDRHHPQCGTVLTGVILLMRESRGSGTAPGAIAEAIRRGTAPAAIVLATTDINLSIGARVAARLYGRACPVLSVSADDYAAIAVASHASIDVSGTVEI